MVSGFHIGGAKVGYDLGEKKRTQRLATGGNEDGEQRVQQSCRVDEFLVPQQNQTSHHLVAQVGLQLIVMQREDLDQIFGELSGSLRVAVCCVGDEVYEVGQAHEAGVIAGGGILEEKVTLRLVLQVLLLVILEVRRRVSVVCQWVLVGLQSRHRYLPSNSVLQARKVGIDLAGLAHAEGDRSESLTFSRAPSFRFMLAHCITVSRRTAVF